MHTPDTPIHTSTHYDTDHHDTHVRDLRAQLRELDLRRSRLPRDSDQIPDYNARIEALTSLIDQYEASIPQRRSDDASLRHVCAGMAVTGLLAAGGFTAAFVLLGGSWWWLLAAGIGALLLVLGWAGATDHP